MCNFYLHSLDQALQELSTQSGGQVIAFRYADDILMLTADRTWGRRAIAVARQVLKRQRQKLNRQKTRLQNVQHQFTWLGVNICPATDDWGGKTRYEYTVPPKKVESMLARIDEMTEPPSERIDASAFDLGRWMKSINEQLDDWFQVYQFAGNAPAVFRAVDEHTAQRVGELIRSIHGLRRSVLERDYRVRLPRGFRSWQVEGCRLIVLASRAPRRPAFLIRRPLWQQRPKRMTTEHVDSPKRITIGE